MSDSNAATSPLSSLRASSLRTWQMRRVATFVIDSSPACSSSLTWWETAVRDSGEVRTISSRLRSRADSNLTHDSLVGLGFWGWFFVGIPSCWGCAGTLSGQ